jgi:hypothetical protein
VNAEVEPYVAVNSSNHSNIIGVWQQDRWNNGGAHGLVAGSSIDGGKTWSETPLPFSACANGLGYERASDPWVSIGPDGTAYTVSISFNQSNNNNAVAAATSRDGGKTWQNLSVIIADNQPTLQFFNDKESVTADPTQAGVAYAVWDRLELPNGNPDANLHTAAYRGPTFFSKTTNGGLTWSSPKIIVNVPSRQQTIGNQIVVDSKTGTLYDFFDLITPPFKVTAFKAAFIKSTDGGNTWTQPQIISTLGTVFVSDPNTGASIRTGDIIPEPAIDPASGKLYITWQDSRFNGGHYDEHPHPCQHTDRTASIHPIDQCQFGRDSKYQLLRLPQPCDPNHDAADRLLVHDINQWRREFWQRGASRWPFRYADGTHRQGLLRRGLRGYRYERDLVPTLLRPDQLG